MQSGIVAIPAAWAAEQIHLRPDYVPVDATVHAIFAAQARARPQAPAIKFNNQTSTFAQLDESSSRLADVLVELGVTRGSLVALLAQRAPEMIIAMLAVLKAGAAYVPFDPAYSDERLAFMAADCDPVVIIAQSSCADRVIGSGAQHTVHCFEDLLRRTPMRSAPAEPSSGRGEDPAYVMYTSGTTGRPKGVVIPHRAILHLVRDQTYFEFSAEQIFLHLTTLSFDPSTLEIWGALLNGGQVAIVPQHDHHSLDDIVAAIEQHQPTSTCLTPGIFHLLVDHKLADLGPLRQIMVGGEILSPSHVRKALDALPACRIVNAYGPTECTTLITHYSASRTGWGSGSVPIGVPLSHTVIEILDEALNPVADGDVGQLCAGGDGLALGYFKRPELTAEKFVVRDGVRLYLTGDLVRRRPDGLIEFIGRSDTQVKIDGKRVELGEIEECLREDPRVADIVVVAETVGRGKRLTAYLTWANLAADVGSQSAADLLADLRKKLPPHMIPAHAVVVDKLPLTPNGKVDRARLPKPPSHLSESVSLPDGEVERALRDIWHTVLGVDRIGLDDNFFDLGGTSVQLMEVHELVQKKFGRDLEIVSLFESPKIADLARLLRGQDAGVSRLDTVQAKARQQGDALKRLRAARQKPHA
ncbi:MAG: non-ribosomal peptide synthetase [Alphaproteobacteria bacterium]|nr:non-ribosomal peptide synthetase [Alphaproteobacteria bacterium]